MGMAPPTTPSSPLPRPTMRHSAAAFLLPSRPPPSSSSSSSPAPAAVTPAAHDATVVALVVLNQPLPRFAPLLWPRGNETSSSSPSTFETLPFLPPLRTLPAQPSLWLTRSLLVCFPWWPGPAGSAALRVCADGGANRVFDAMPGLLPGQDPDEVRQRHKPEVIKGDMDSVRPEVKEYYSNLGTEIVDESNDQDTTDLHKCISYIIDKCSPATDQSNLCILVLGALGGRFDHEMGNINVLHLFPNIKIVLLSDDCLIFLLPKTHTHEIHIEQSIEGPHCGLIPIGMPSTGTTTTGLRWNLDNTSMSYGGLISTSNIVEENEVKVTSDSDLIWTISLRI